MQFLKLTQGRVPDSEFLKTLPSPLLLAAVALAARLGTGPQLCPSVLVAALPAYGVFHFSPAVTQPGDHASSQLQTFVQKQGINFLLIKGAPGAERK